ncbi:YggS family pyridoxal phosphate enzyme [Conexibacter sp. DBS9H8]|uniref:YggS family pyridoxal phosphate enzyme n=1 Tax=Conexibacter sp. DBS9H8 TaxID=2937801 RepID=UPI00200BC684|nr:YggS family pyridoxal phosphate enzyme [Conexibacter sp. DBS9H8]
MIEPVHHLEPGDVAANLARVRAEIAAAGRDPATVEILAAIKYLPGELLPALAAGGIVTVGENRVQDLLAKQEQTGIDRFAHWDFIGALQSRKVAALLGRVRYIHSLASESALAQLARHDPGDTQVLIEVNVAADPAKAGIAPAGLARFLARCPVPVAGLMTMPPRAAAPEESRPAFRALAELADAHGLRELSMGTSQDYRVALEEGATIIRLGRGLFTAS